MNSSDFDFVTPKFAAEVVDKVFAAWNTNDGVALADLCTEDVEWIDAVAPTELKGRADVAGFVTWMFGTLPDFRYEPIGGPAISMDGSTVFQAWRITGTNTGPIDPPGFSATGKMIDFLGVDQFKFRGGLIAYYQAFFDRMDLLIQMGIFPPPKSSGERAMVMFQRLGSLLRR
jgi:hypothetical protein